MSTSRRLALRFHLMLCANCRRFFRQIALTAAIASTPAPLSATPTDQEIDQLIELLRD